MQSRHNYAQVYVLCNTDDNITCCSDPSGDKIEGIVASCLYKKKLQMKTVTSVYV